MTRTRCNADATCAVVSGLLSLAWSLPAVAEEEDLQTKLANPVADLISVPFQFTTTPKSGPLEKPQHTLNIQPVYPTTLGDIRLIHRVILPVLSNPAVVPGQDRENGIGDIVYEAFFSPAAASKTIWAVGPIVQLRTATDPRLGSGKWAAGPAALALVQPSPWSVGALVTQLWSFAGDENRASVNQTQIQPLLSYKLGPEHSIAYTGTITANWNEDRSSQRWTVPLGITYSMLTKPAGFVPVNYIFGGGYNVIRPDNTGGWFLRFQINFVLAK